jgi:hypothetical protein
MEAYDTENPTRRLLDAISREDSETAESMTRPAR